MHMNEHLLIMFDEACGRIMLADIESYLCLKRMLNQRKGFDQQEFRKLFTRYYGLNIGGTTEEWKNRYFELLFEFHPTHTADPYTPILTALYEYPNRQGKPILAASFVSKLVSIHDESKPIFDAHVSHFFGCGVPSIGPVVHRISGFLANLDRIKNIYETWAKNPQFLDILGKLAVKHVELTACHPTRLCDFLVWTIGRMNIGQDQAKITHVKRQGE